MCNSKGLKIIGRIVDKKKTVGYTLLDLASTFQATREFTDLQTVELVKQGKVVNAKVVGEKIAGNGEDLRKLPIKSLNSPIDFLGTNTVVKITDIDSDLQDAPFKTWNGEGVHLVQQNISLVCKNRQVREELMVKINDATRLPEYSDVGIQSLDIIGMSRGKERIDIKFVHYKPENIFKFIGMLQVMTKSKFIANQKVLFLRGEGRSFEFDVDFRKGVFSQVGTNNILINDNEDTLMKGLLGYFKKYVKNNAETGFKS